MGAPPRSRHPGARRILNTSAKTIPTNGRPPYVRSKTQPKLSFFTLMMINVAAVLSLRALPGMAEYGYALIVYLAWAPSVFSCLRPLVSAELASGWKQEGGVYLWVKEAFGAKWGFVAIFMQWVENLPWFPAVLAFAASDVAYVFNQSWPTARFSWWA